MKGEANVMAVMVIAAKENHAGAAEWVKQQAESGNADAQMELAEMYNWGKGGKSVV